VIEAGQFAYHFLDRPAFTLKFDPSRPTWQERFREPGINAVI
jgi:hypothetical protein